MFKTGTTSLGKALNILGYKTFNGPIRDTSICPQHTWGAPVEVFVPYRKQLCKFIDQWDAMEDFPFMYIFPLLEKWYPDSKFILTCRNPESVATSDINMAVRNGLSPDAIPPPSAYIERYNRHYDSVVSFFKDRENKILKVNWEEGHGWNELCHFLGCKIPDLPFPHANRANVDHFPNHHPRNRHIAHRYLSKIKRRVINFLGN